MIDSDQGGLSLGDYKAGRPWENYTAGMEF